MMRGVLFRAELRISSFITNRTWENICVAYMAVFTDGCTFKTAVLSIEISNACEYSKETNTLN